MLSSALFYLLTNLGNPRSIIRLRPTARIAQRHGCTSLVVNGELRRAPITLGRHVHVQLATVSSINATDVASKC